MPQYHNLVRETSSSVGTGNKVLAAVNGYQRVSTAYGTGDNGGDNPILFISNRDAAEWEVVQGYMSDANTFVPVTVLDSSNSGSAVNFSAGTKDVTSAPDAGFYNSADDYGLITSSPTATDDYGSIA